MSNFISHVKIHNANNCIAFFEKETGKESYGVYPTNSPTDWVVSCSGNGDTFFMVNSILKTLTVATESEFDTYVMGGKL
tara:strand:+ start:137 stop:373 length:237 start_codon:yes stop_codon:yes gene_type:complete